MRNIRFRLVLPIVFGFLAVALMAWDYENQRMVEIVGMGWDTGPPMWPYRAISDLLFAVNAPAYVLAAPFFFFHYMQTASTRYPLLFPLIVFWWWWIGTRIDFGVLVWRHYRHPKLAAGLLVVIAVVPVYFGCVGALDGFEWWKEYGRTSPPVNSIVLIGIVGPALWFLVLASGALKGAIQLAKWRLPLPTETRPKYMKFAVGTTLFFLYVVVVALFGRTRPVIVDHDSCVIDRLNGLGCLHGNIVDESGKSVSGIMVDLIPTYKTGDARWIATKHDWTDEQGRYNLNQLEPGEYFLAVHGDDAPDSDYPFATAYYPGVENETTASSVTITTSSHTNIDQLRLRRLEVMTIKVTVMWADGTRPERSNLRFHNATYPQQASIGRTEPQVDDGMGQFTLPTGFEYDALAYVQCDSGKIIESRESRPVQHITVGKGSTPAGMTFVIPGPPCKPD